MKQKIENWLLRKLFNSITVEEILTREKGFLLINGERATEDELKQLKAEARALKGFRLWKLMTDSTKHVAQDKIFNKATTFEEVRYGKSMMWCIDLQQSIIDTIEKQ